VKRSFLLMTIVLLCVLSAGCKQTELPFTGYGYIRNLDGSYVSGVSVKLGDSGIVHTDEKGLWSSVLEGGADVIPVPEHKDVVFYPIKSTVTRRKPRADFTMMDLSIRDTPVASHQSWMLANALGYPTGFESFYSEKINPGLLGRYTASAMAKGEEVDQDYLEVLRRAMDRTEYTSFTFAGGKYAIVRPRRYSENLGIDSHAIFVEESGEWKVLLPGFLFFGEFGIDPTVSDVMKWLDRWEVTSGELREWVHQVLFTEVFDRIFADTIGRKAYDGFLTEGTRFRYRKSILRDGIIELEVNEDLVNVEKAYRGRLTLGAPAQFERNVARFIKHVFDLDESIHEVHVRVYVPVYTDDYGTVEDREVGIITMDRSTYERIRWDTIRTEMVTEHLKSQWWY
jgi:hypothetical protein